MKFSIGKSQVVIFHRVKIPSVHSKLKIYGQNLPVTDTVKYLGVILDKTLTFRAHVLAKLDKGRRALFKICKAVGKLWGPSPVIMKWMYTAIIRPAISYGNLVWGKVTRLKYFQEKAKRIQRLALMSMAPVRTHSPTVGLEIVAHIPPLELYIQGEMAMTYNRIKGHLDTSITEWSKDRLTSHLVYAHRLAVEAGIDGVRSDVIPLEMHWDTMCTTSVECFNRCSHSPPGEVQAFTDGSRKDEVTGAACVLFEENLNGVFVASDKYAENLGEIATVFQAEVYAIIMATEALEERVRNDEEGKIKTLRIVSDSASAIAAMGSFMTNSGLVLECRKRLSSLGRKRLLTLQWVKAHNGDEANELVDSWAKYATTLSRDKVEPFLPVPKTWLRKKTKEFVCQLWKERWKAQPQARQTKIFFSEPNEKLSRSILKLSRQTYGEIFRWISGHNFLKRHRSLLEPLIYPDSTCRACLEEEETSSHLILQCPAFGQARHGIFGQHLLPEITEWTVSQLWRMIGVTRRLCPEFLPEQVEIQVVPDVGAEESVPEEG